MFLSCLHSRLSVEIISSSATRNSMRFSALPTHYLPTAIQRTSSSRNRILFVLAERRRRDCLRPRAPCSRRIAADLGQISREISPATRSVSLPTKCRAAHSIYASFAACTFTSGGTRCLLDLTDLFNNHFPASCPVSGSGRTKNSIFRSDRYRENIY